MEGPRVFSIVIAVCHHSLRMTNEQPVNDTVEAWRARIDRLPETVTSIRPLYHLDNFDAFVLTEHATEIADVRAWVSRLEGTWAFRGQRDAKWSLDPAIDRASLRSVKLPTDDGRDSTDEVLLNPFGNEKNMLEEFRCRAHNFLKSTPADDEILDWLALMQHYGAPTRMLDFTYSPYVAMYFAIEEAASVESLGHAVWAVSLDWLRSMSNQALSDIDAFFESASTSDTRKHAKKINALLQANIEEDRPGIPDVVTSATNLRVNERQAAQQGLFLFVLSSQIRLKVSLLKMMAEPSVVQAPVLRRLVLSPEARLDLLFELKRMNITGASLFPGLDGFSRGLRTNLELDVEVWKRKIENPFDNGR